MTLSRLHPAPDVVSFAVLFSSLLVAAPAAGQADDPDPERYSEQIQAFLDRDAKNTSPANAILFVGSSSIRFWDTADAFPDRVVINRGFGGAHVSDVNHWVDETVVRHAPDVVVFYAGDNDLAAGKTPAQVAEDYRGFVDAVTAAAAGTDIVFISVKPSLARWDIWDAMQETNRRIRAYTGERSDLHFADVGPPMLGEDGEPIPAFFVRDGLHMTPAGYDAWHEVLDRSLRALGR